MAPVLGSTRKLVWTSIVYFSGTFCARSAVAAERSAAARLGRTALSSSAGSAPSAFSCAAAWAGVSDFGMPCDASWSM